jgi:hypothetical protein
VSFFNYFQKKRKSVQCLFIVIFLFLLLPIFSCSIRYQNFRLYSGPELPKEQIALLVHRQREINFRVYQYTKKGYVGGEMQYSGPTKIGLLPDKYRVTADCELIKQQKSIDFDARAGRVYLLQICDCLYRDPDSNIHVPHHCSVTIQDITETYIP